MSSLFSWILAIQPIFFKFFLHLFILQAIYIALQDLKMKMLFVELNNRLQLVLAFDDSLFFQGVLLWEAEGPIFWNNAPKELNVGQSIRRRIWQQTYAKPQQAHALEMVLRLVLHVWPCYSCFVIKYCGHVPLRHVCAQPTMIKVD